MNKLELARRHFAETRRVRDFTQPEINNLGKYVAVAEELVQEPFFSADTHDVLHQSSETPPRFFGSFGHPAFLKSAILPFRKLWMPTEPCAFQKIRDLVYEIFPESELLQGLKYWFYEAHAQTLNRKVFDDGKITTVAQVLDIWINTQAAHTGQRTQGNRLIGDYTVMDFEEALKLHGRPRFEFEFRIGLKCVGCSFASFYTNVVAPLMGMLEDNGQRPDFEVMVAVNHSAYPRDSKQIRVQDHFWHLDKETPEETFDRLLERQAFGNLDSFFCGYFFARRPAFEAVQEFETLAAFLAGTGGEVISTPLGNGKLMSRFWAKGDFNYNGGEVIVFENRRVQFHGRSQDFMAAQYSEFRGAFLAHRESVIAPSRKWHGNWHGI